MSHPLPTLSQKKNIFYPLLCFLFLLFPLSISSLICPMTFIKIQLYIHNLASVWFLLCNRNCGYERNIHLV